MTSAQFAVEKRVAQHFSGGQSGGQSSTRTSHPMLTSSLGEDCGQMNNFQRMPPQMTSTVEAKKLKSIRKTNAPTRDRGAIENQHPTNVLCQPQVDARIKVLQLMCDMIFIPIKIICVQSCISNFFCIETIKLQAF